MKSPRIVYLLALGILAFCQLSVSAEKPNILWIFSEDLSPYMGCYDDPVNAGHTPSIDQLAAEGVLFMLLSLSLSHYHGSDANDHWHTSTSFRSCTGGRGAGGYSDSFA